MDVIVVVLIVYLIALFGLAFWSRQETNTMMGFFLAGKKLPAWVIAFSTNATGESGWLLLGLTGMGYAVGVQAFWVVIGEVIGIALAWAFVARRFKIMSDKSNSITVPDALVGHFGDIRNILRTVSVIVIIVMVTAYVAAQMVASGKAFGTFMGIDYTTAVFMGAAITVAYTYVGGFKAVAYTDLMQGILMLIGLILIPAVAIPAAGGWDAVVATLAADDIGLLDPMGPGGEGLAGWVGIVSFLVIGLPFFAVPQLLTRFMSARDVGEIRKAGVLSVIVLICFDVGAVLTGMAGRALFPGISDPETIMPLLSGELFPPIVTGVLMVVVLGAIMSTADSLLILASSAVVRDFLQKIRNVGKPDAELARYGKYVTIVIGVLAVGFALSAEQTIFWFVLFAWSGLGAAFGPPVFCALFDKKSNIYGAIAGMVSGFLTDVIWVLFLKDSFFGLYEILPAFLVGIPTMMIVSRMTAEKAKARAEAAP